MKKFFLALSLVIVLGTIMAGVTLAGTRTDCNQTYPTNSAVMERQLSGLSRVTLYGHGTTGNAFLRLQYWNGSAWANVALTAATTTDGEAYLNVTTPNSYNVPFNSTWRVYVDPVGAPYYCEWYQLIDAYGDPAYELSLGEQTAGTTTKSRAALDSGNEWELDRSFSFDGILEAITLAGMGLLSVAGLMFRMGR